MMGRSHALSGAATWLAGSWVMEQFFDYEPQTVLYLALGTAMCAGGALLPDLDLSGKVTTGQGGATVAHTFGPVSMFLSEVIEKLSLGIYTATRLKHDPRRDYGHRTFTHTLPFVVLMGWGATYLCQKFGKWAVLPILFLMIGLAVRGVFEHWAKRAGWVITTLVAGGCAYYTFLNLESGRGYPLIGFAVGVGCLVHLMGDIITSAGVPILWPIPTGFKNVRLWRMIGVPNALAVEVGGKVERIVLSGLFIIISFSAALALAGRAVLRKFDIEI
jgi:membrane-bound metal-dependent hydrolase YbcI (DUF457 family)